MPGIVCLGDATTHGGKVITATSTLFINGIQVALVGDLVSCPKHGVNPIWICPYISRHLLSLNPLLACCRRYSRGER